MLAGVLFSIGVVGVLVPPQHLVIFMCVELMLNAANLSIVAFAERWIDRRPGVRVLRAWRWRPPRCRSAWRIIIDLFRKHGTVDVDAVNLLKG